MTMTSQSPRKLLFAVTVVSTMVTSGAGEVAMANPLRNGAERPACGNIGQRGQSDAAPSAAAAAPATPARTAAAAPVRTRQGRLGTLPIRASGVIPPQVI